MDDRGAEVTLRRDANRIGKGYALDHGVRILSANPPQVIIFVDADCEVGQRSLEILAKHCALTGRPAQARYSRWRIATSVCAAAERARTDPERCS